MANEIKGVSIVLTPEKSEELFHNSLCNGHQIAHYGLSLEYDNKEYQKAKNSLIKKKVTPCLEDVWLEMLRMGYTLTLVDNENGEDDKPITLKEVHERVQKTPIRHLMNAINEEDDGDTADVILQTVFYKDVIFG